MDKIKEGEIRGNERPVYQRLHEEIETRIKIKREWQE